MPRKKRMAQAHSLSEVAGPVQPGTVLHDALKILARSVADRLAGTEGNTGATNSATALGHNGPVCNPKATKG